MRYHNIIILILNHALGYNRSDSLFIISIWTFLELFCICWILWDFKFLRRLSSIDSFNWNLIIKIMWKLLILCKIISVCIWMRATMENLRKSKEIQFYWNLSLLNLKSLSKIESMKICLFGSEKNIMSLSKDNINPKPLGLSFRVLFSMM